MSEPGVTAETVEEVVPGVWHWAVHDDRIDFISASYAIVSDDGTVLVDPLPLAEQPFRRLGRVTAICLTCGSHQRSAWRLRRELGVPVYGPSLSREIDEEPDERYGDGARLPGGLLAVFTPGAGTTQHTLLLDRDGGVAFVPDLLVRTPGRELSLIPEQYAHDMAGALTSTRKLLDLPFSVLCLGHGTPITDDPKGQIRQALERRTAAPSDASDWESS